MSDAVVQLTAMIYDYCELFDTGRFDAFAAQFEHGQWHRAEPGAAGARQWIADNVLTYDGLPGTKHLTSNLVVEVDEVAGTAAARSYITVLQAAPGFPLQPIFAGRYRDRFVRVDGTWRWARREVLADLYGDASRHVRSAQPADDPLRKLQDRQAIADLCVQYTTALDTKDWDLLASCFTDDPVFVHPGGRLTGFDEILARTSAALNPLDVTQHLLGNVIVDVAGDTAQASCYFQAQHVRAGTPGGEHYIIAGRYADTLVRTGVGWRIAERVQTYAWRAGNRAVVAR
ncbi:MAG TPA: nuclear transport factor 2 family protein [Jatrophihabitans sp.]|nr:nuclear transport factor 2 family protein [Jatrophihabitans sp.]